MDRFEIYNDEDWTQAYNPAAIPKPISICPLQAGTLFTECPVKDFGLELYPLDRLPDNDSFRDVYSNALDMVYKLKKVEARGTRDIGIVYQSQTTRQLLMIS